jgi:Tol biopolymer transport system component/DNA-binding winged helix-turn-helix (wHTH) protein
MLGKLQFGVYELDRDALELRKDGVPVRLQEQPLRVLATLVERPGEIVTREELQDRIWGKDTFVDFEQSLNKAVNRLREALNDEAAQPRYVETVPRRGYRFIARVTGPIPIEPPGQTLLLSSVSGAEPTVASHGSWRILILAAASVLFAVGVAALVLWKRFENPTSAETRHMTSAAYCCPRLSPDGKLLAYVSGTSSGRMHIWVQQTAGGDAIPVTRGSDGEFNPDFSPDGTHIAFVSGTGRLYIAPSLSGEPRPVGKAYGQNPLFSPNGRQILYWEGPHWEGPASIVSVDSGEQTSLSFNRDFLVHAPPLWSPNGEEIIFYGVSRSKLDKPDGWWIAPLAGGEPRSLSLPHGGQDDIGEPVVHAWVRNKDGKQWMIYSESTGAVWKLFHIRISAIGNIEGKPEQLATGTGKLTGEVSVAEDGTLVYATRSFSESIYEIPIDSRGQKSGATVQLPLPEGVDYTSPSISRDGRWMAYHASILGKSNSIVLRDFRSGTDRILDDKGRSSDNNPQSITGYISNGDAIIAPDGSKVIFERDCKTARFPSGAYFPCSFMVPAAGGEPEQVCEFCTPRGFSSDGSIILMQKYPRIHEGRPIGKIVALDLASKTEKDFLSSTAELYHAFFSWDDHWVVFKTPTIPGSLKSHILIASVRDHSAVKEADWIAVTDGQYNSDKPQFSPDGNTVYFTSTRDGYLCVWAQKLDPETKRPLGNPIAYEHFHNFAQRDAVLREDIGWDSDLSVARDKMTINLPQVHYEIWMTQVK